MRPKIVLLYILCYHICPVIISIFVLLSYLFCYNIGSVCEAACDYIFTLKKYNNNINIKAVLHQNSH